MQKMKHSLTVNYRWHGLKKRAMDGTGKGSFLRGYMASETLFLFYMVNNQVLIHPICRSYRRKERDEDDGNG